jgi:acetolactate synthase-1/2/3 large subunit
MPAANETHAKAPSAAASPPAPARHGLAEAASLIASAKAPVIIASSYGHTENAVEKLGALAESWALPVVNFRPRRIALSTSHPMHAGFESAPFIKDADVIIVLDSDVPWIPSLHKVNPQAKIIHIGADPLFANYPMRSFPCDLALTADGELAVEALIDELGTPEGDVHKQIEVRRESIDARKAEQLEARKATEAELENASTINANFLAKCLNANKGDDAVILSETQVSLSLFDFTKAGSFFSVSPAGGLGWGLGAALGLKLAKPDARVITLIGDGAYMFGNPTPAHFVAQAYELPTLTIVANNRKWGAVRKATLGMYPDGAATRVNDVAFTNLEPSPAYEKIIEASGGYGEKVTTPAELEPALQRAFKALDEGRPALLNVQVEYSDGQALAEAKK